VVGGYLRGSLFVNHPNVATIDRQGGYADFWYGRLATTDCNGTPLSTASVTREILTPYPQPADNALWLQGLESSQNYTLYDLHGREVSQGVIGPNQAISLERLDTGVYLLQLETGETVKVVMR
jgi:hypothetical protein